MGHMYFVRHGQTVWNVENKICGSTDIDLTEKGHEQAVKTGKKILSENIKADMKLKGLKGKEYIYSIGEWDKYIKFLKENM